MDTNNAINDKVGDVTKKMTVEESLTLILDKLDRLDERITDTEDKMNQVY